MTKVHSLENESLIVEVCDKGAELVRIYDKKQEREALWTADPAFWGRHAPVLFPFVGKVNGGVYRHEGKEYSIGQHGFARDKEFVCIEKGAFFVTHRLTADEETKKVYPFDFVLDITHKIEGNRVTVEWKVENPGERTMYYSIGGHPAFCVDSLLGCRLVFEGLEKLSCVGIDLPTSSADAEHPVTLPLKEGVYTVDAHSFDADTMIFDGGQVKKVSLEEADGTRRATLICPDSRSLGVWSPAGNQAPFICLEPWLGRCDNLGFAGELSERFDEQSLEPGQSFRTAYELLIGE